MKQMGRAAKIFEDGRMQSASRLFTLTVEYDHPLQRIALKDRKIHIVDDYGRMPCSRDRRCKGDNRITIADNHPCDPCPACFMEGDLLALRISLPEYVKTINDLCLIRPWKGVLGDGSVGDPLDNICGECDETDG